MKGIHTVVKVGDKCESSATMMGKKSFRMLHTGWKPTMDKVKAINDGALIHWQDKFWRFQDWYMENGKLDICTDINSIELSA